MNTWRRRLRELDVIVGGPAGAIVLAGLIVAVAWLVQRDLFVNLADEGFLWYGTWRTGLGEVPLRDFQSYDPGRYYWGAFFSLFLGDGLLALRASNSLFAWLGLSCGALLIRRLDRDLLFVLPATLVLFLWMFPRHKLFESSVALIATWALTRLLEQPSVRRHFEAGLIVGLVACIGRNHGGYALVAFMLAAGLAWWRLDRSKAPRRLVMEKALASGAGVLVGYAPILGMLVFVPRFPSAFVESAAVFVRAGSTNLGRPVPWLWDVLADPARFAAFEATEGASLWIVSAFYTGWPWFVAASLAACLIRRGPLGGARAVLAAASVASIPYFHFATSRAGLSHLAQSMHPLLVALLALPFVLAPRRALLAGLVWAAVFLAISGVSVLKFTPWWLAREIGTAQLVTREVGDDELRMDRPTSRVFDALALVRKELLASPEERVLVVPLTPLFYPALQRASPLHELYMTFPESPMRQRAMIDRIERQSVAVVIACDVPIDDREDLRFRNTHELLWRYIEEHFARIEGLRFGPRCTVWRRGDDPS